MEARSEWRRADYDEELCVGIDYVEAPEGLENAVGKRAYRCGEDFAEAGRW